MGRMRWGGGGMEKDTSTGNTGLLTYPRSESSTFLSRKMTSDSR